MDLISLGKEELGRREFFDRLHESLTVVQFRDTCLAGTGASADGAWLSRARQIGRIRRRIRFESQPK